MIAGPTELGIIADASSDPELVALDLISQAEHSKDTMCFVITQSKTVAKQIQKSIEKSISGTRKNLNNQGKHIKKWFHCCMQE